VEGKTKMNVSLEEVFAELEDQKYEMYGTMVIDYDDVLTALNHLKKELQERLKSASRTPPATEIQLLKELLEK